MPSCPIAREGGRGRGGQAQDSSVNFVGMGKRLKILCECECLSNTGKNPCARNFVYIFFKSGQKRVYCLLGQLLPILSKYLRNQVFNFYAKGDYQKNIINLAWSFIYTLFIHNCIMIAIIICLPTKHSVTLRGERLVVDKVCIEVQKTSNNAGGKPTRGFSLHSTQNIQCLILNYAQDFGNRVMESLKRTTNSNGLHSRKVELSHVKYFHAFLSTLTYVSPISANNDKRR